MPPGPVTTWLRRGTILGMAALFMALALSPAGLSAGRLPMPDPLFALLILCRLRRPETVPIALLIGLTLISDLLRGGPLGIGTLGVLAVSEALGLYRDRILRRGFFVEWTAVSAAFAVQLAVQYLVLRLTFAPCPSVEALALFTATTALSYPVVLILMRGLLPLRPTSTQGIPGT
ncbi:MAG: hypothetical protein AAGE13_04290 [Pseudomonadota bacterium]